MKETWLITQGRARSPHHACNRTRRLDRIGAGMEQPCRGVADEQSGIGRDDVVELRLLRIHDGTERRSSRRQPGIGHRIAFPIE